MNAAKTSIDWANVRRRLERSQATLESGLAADDQPALDILRRRAAELARRRQTADPVATGVRMLVCSLGSERYGLELESVREVLSLSNCTRVPGGPPELLGVTNLRGKIRSVLSLAHVLQLPDGDSGERLCGHLVIVHSAGVEVALQVDQVERIAVTPIESLEPPGDHQREASGHYVRGVTAEGIIVLDLARIFADQVLSGNSRKRS